MCIHSVVSNDQNVQMTNPLPALSVDLTNPIPVSGYFPISPDGEWIPRNVFVGLDVHKGSITAVAFDCDLKIVVAAAQLKRSAKDVKRFVDELNPGDATVVLGYEAGCLGFTLQRKLKKLGYECVILAPTTMATCADAKKKKTDRRDAENIAVCLANQTYKPVVPLDEEDEDTRNFIRMRDDLKVDLRMTKQQILAFCLQLGHEFTETKTPWTAKHREWLKKLELSTLQRKTLDRYLATLNYLEDAIADCDREIEAIAATERYAERIGMLCSIYSIRIYTALAFLSEIGDFSRFATAAEFAAYLGLVPGEHSSGNTQHRTGITKTGNTHLRKILAEVAASFFKSSVYGEKSKDLKKRQAGQPDEVVAYADRCMTRLRRKANHLLKTLKKPYNVAKMAIARELACFIWGMMTGNIGARTAA